ncbi:MAG TPA: biotin/lipoyl-containing protein [Terriglobales bacterium]|nr:biotin/lipoyl-containing protein [Terriglobales bacterium]
MKFEVEIGGRTRALDLDRGASGGWAISIDGSPVPADVTAVGDHGLSLLIDGRSWTFHWALDATTPAGSRLWVAGGGHEAIATVRDPRRLSALRPVEPSGTARLLAPMAGKVVRLLAAVGDPIEAGQGVVVLEAMKMQNEVRSPKSGTLRTLAVTAGSTVAPGALLAEIE